MTVEKSLESGFADVRNTFPVLKKRINGQPLIYFDSAATAQKPLGVIEAMDRFYREDYGTVHRAVYALARESTTQYQQVREKVRAFLNAENQNEIIYTRGTTESINLVAYSFGKAYIHAGDEIIISENEHHSNIVPWQILCEDRGATLKVIPMLDTGELDMDAYAALLSRKTKIVAVAHVSNSLGTVHPLKKIIPMAHACGAKVLVDGAQASAHMAVDVRGLDADFYVFSGHKTFGPTGIGILYGKKALLEAMPPYQGGGDMVKRVTFEKTTYAEPPLKFEAGTPMIGEVIGLGAAIDFLTQIGMNNIHRWEQSLLARATKMIEQIDGVRIIGTAKEKGGIISFVVDGVHPLDLGTILDLNGVAVRTGHHCAQPTMDRFCVPGTTRLSFALYNTPGEIDRFGEILAGALLKLR